MKLEQLAGNEALKRQLSAQARGRGLSHAYLISGPAGSGKRTLSRLLAAAMVCTGEGEAPCGICPGCKKALGGIHPDIMVLGEEDKEITVGQARMVRSDAYIRPNEGERKVYVFHNAQDMTTAAQNALLKLLEEGPAYAAFLLLTENPGSLLPTIRSRCEGLALTPPSAPPEPEGGASPLWEESARFLSLLAQGSELDFAAWCVGLEKWPREDFLPLLERSLALLRDALALQTGSGAITASPRELPALRQAAALPARTLLSAAGLLEKLRNDAAFNVNQGQLCGALAAGIYGGQL